MPLRNMPCLKLERETMIYCVPVTLLANKPHIQFVLGQTLTRSVIFLPEISSGAPIAYFQWRILLQTLSKIAGKAAARSWRATIR